MRLSLSSKASILRRNVLFVLLVVVVLCPKAQAQHLRIFACAIANDSAGTFMGASSNGSGLYQSDDTGKTWKHLGWDNIKCYSMDMVQSSNGRILYMATGLGVLRSTDYGEHWKQITDWRISEVMDVAIDQRQPEIIYVVTAHGPWRLLDSAGDKVEEKSVTLDSTSLYCSRIVSKAYDSYHYAFMFRCESRLYETESNLDNWVRYLSIQSLRSDEDWSEYSPYLLQDTLIQTNLSQRQIWTLKSFVVTP